MARLAGAAEAAFVRIRVARGTLRKSDPRIFHVGLCICNGWVALGAGRLFVRSRQGIFRFRVVEKGSWLPGLHTMATRAIFPELAAVLVLMTVYTLARKTQKSSIKVFDLNASSSRTGNEIGLVTTPACNSNMFPGERKARLAVVHCFAARFPVNKLKIGAVMVGMARRAIFAGSVRFDPHRMHSAPLRNPFPNFGVAFQAFQLRSAAAEVMAFGAVRRT